MDYKKHLKIALQHLELAEKHNEKLGPVINEVARFYRGKPRLRKRVKQLDFIASLDVTRGTKFASTSK